MMFMFWAAISFIGFLIALAQDEFLKKSCSYYGNASYYCCLLPLIRDNRLLTQRKVIQASIMHTLVLCFNSVASHFTICLDFMAFINSRFYYIQKRIKIPAAPSF